MSKTDYENIETAIISLGLAEEYLTCFAMHIQKVKPLAKTAHEIKVNIGDLRVSKKLLELELGGLRDAGMDNFQQ
jgi:hypothetical protein